MYVSNVAKIKGQHSKCHFLVPTLWNDFVFHGCLVAPHMLAALSLHECTVLSILVMFGNASNDLMMS